MQLTSNTLLRLEFEARIFVSLSIVAFVCAVSYSVFAESQSLIALVGRALQIPSRTILTTGYVAAAMIMAGVSLFRMWAGGALTPQRVMSFRVRVDALNTAGPYRCVRNPIYLADFIAMCTFALCLPPVGVIMPFLFLVHYNRIIRYEEISLTRRFGKEYEEYSRKVPRLFPRFWELNAIRKALREFTITGESARHNALYLLFVPGFLVSAFTHEFWHAVVIGLPGTIDWAIIHTKIGVRQ